MKGEVTVAPEHFASRIVDGVPDVFSTPSLGALVERTAAQWLATGLEAGQTSVGAQIIINHTAATPVGMTVTAEVTLEDTDGRRYDFRWTAHDGVDEVGNGTHQRFAVNEAKSCSGWRESPEARYRSPRRPRAAGS
ncbi:MAG: thioesterase family protein [Dehalococcoidia bacterium]|nr:thioesterase family protein [Dehalococcoidia bacterium]